MCQDVSQKPDRRPAFEAADLEHVEILFPAESGKMLIPDGRAVGNVILREPVFGRLHYVIRNVSFDPGEFREYRFRTPEPERSIGIGSHRLFDAVPSRAHFVTE